MSSNERRQCNCEECSEKETVELIEESMELILEASTKSEVREILYDLCEFGRVIGIKEYLHAQLIDNSFLLDALNTIGEDEEDYEDDVEIDFKFSLEARSDDGTDDFFTGEFWSQG